MFYIPQSVMVWHRHIDHISTVLASDMLEEMILIHSKYQKYQLIGNSCEINFIKPLEER